MEIKTHDMIDQGLCGKPVKLENGCSCVEFTGLENMTVDSWGLVHGGFIFGLADYAAMIAVNHPNVVLGAADVKFLKPVKIGDKLISEARLVTEKGKKRIVDVIVSRGDEKVFEGTFTCFVLDSHVLS